MGAIDRNMRHEVWLLRTAGETIKGIHYLTQIPLRYVKELIEEFKKAEKDTHCKIQEKKTYDEFYLYSKFVMKKQNTSAPFVLLSNNKELNRLAKKLKYIK